jgi:rod shape-determining protein MreC
VLPIPSRHRPLALLAAVLLLQVLLLAVQIKREQDVRLIRVWAVAAVTPLQSAGSAAVGWFTGLWDGYVGLRRAHNENRALRGENEQLKLRLAQLESRAAEAERVAGLLGFRSLNPDAPMLLARVIGAGAAGTSRTVFLNRGERDGVRKNIAVITPDGVVGRILEVFPATAQVQLMTDRDSGVGALLENSRTQGIIRGSGDPTVMLHNIVPEQEVAVGERILTSGLDRIFPKDLPVGVVERVSSDRPFQQIVVRPAARLDRLEEVIVLLSLQELVIRSEAELSESAEPPARPEAPGDGMARGPGSP